MIDIRRLEILRELDRCGTVAATAQAVHLTPSAVSQQLAALAREAGTPMLERDGRRVRLSEAARVLLAHAHAIFTQLEHAEADLAAFRRGSGGTVRIGTFNSAIEKLGVPAVDTLAHDHGIRAELQDVDTDLAADAHLLARAIDVAIVEGERPLGRPGSALDPRLQDWHLADDPMDLLLPQGHRLAQRDDVRLADLADDDWILARPGSSYSRIAATACEDVGFVPRGRHHTTEFVGLVALVAAGQGVALLPRLVQHVFRHEPVVLKQPSDRIPLRRIGLRIRAGSAEQPHIAPTLAAIRRAAAALRQTGPAAEPLDEPAVRTPGRVTTSPTNQRPARPGARD